MQAINTPAQSVERGHYTVLSALAPQGNWWHTVIYRHVWTEAGGPNSEMLWLFTAMGNEPDEQLVDNLIERGSMLVQAAIERQT